MRPGGRLLGITRQTAGAKRKCPGLLTLDELAAIAAARKMTAEEIGTAVMSWRKETRVNRK